eukprot:TRINITY_DN2234_c0_g1_i15.p1 TRINITY_DN2234_c0_g1~~TRINITY_DN2234_c0_g1_i15.p1  ORF type:complete len:917 (-),score=74.23 TRINITY_DN2234_c0_g1_i15:578-3328(-)
MLRSLKLKQQIVKELPDVVVWVETNLEEDWNPNEMLYQSFRTENAKDGGVCIIVKKQLCPVFFESWSKYALAVKCDATGLCILGLYTPYKELEGNVLEFVERHRSGTNTKWLAFGDHEGEVSKFANLGCMKFLPKASRERNGRSYATDAFYGSITISGKVRNKVSDHYLLQVTIPDQYKVRTKQEQSISRMQIIKWATSKSKMRQEMILQWPWTPLSQIACKYIKPKPRRVKVWVIKGIQDWDEAMFKQWIARRRKRAEEDIKQCVLECNMMKLANKLKWYWNRMKKMRIVNQITDRNGKVVQGKAATNAISHYFSDLYKDSAPLQHNAMQSDNISSWEAEEAISQIAKGKALGIDEFPDELVEDPDIRQNMINWIVKKASGEPIEAVYLTGKLMVINKTKLAAPKIEQTRGITILSAVYKACELAWFAKYGRIIWSHIGKWQNGFRKGYGTQIQVVRLKKWIDNNKRSAIVIFVDVKKAFDSIRREDVYRALRKCGVSEAGVQWYERLTKGMHLQFDTETAEYNRGVPQGSVLSPTMFALVYDVLLREADQNGWKILAYADDLVIGVTTVKDYKSVVDWLSTWKWKASLEVNIAKTVEMHFGRLRKFHGVFKESQVFKYLGVDICSSYMVKCARKRLQKQAEEYRVKSEKAKYTNVGAAKIGWIWWTVSKILYAAASDVALQRLKASKVEEISLKAARKTYGIGRGIPNAFAMDFFQLTLRQTILRMAEKLRQQMGESLCIRERVTEHWRKQWIAIAARNDLRINSTWQWMTQTIWSRQGKLMCKICGCPANMLHLQCHQKVDKEVEEIVYLMREKGIKAIVEIEAKYGSQECDKMLDKMTDAHAKMMKNSKYVPYKAGEGHSCLPTKPRVAIGFPLQCRGVATGFPLQCREGQLSNPYNAGERPPNAPEGSLKD